MGKALGHPLHPPLVHLPMGLWIATAVWDGLALSTGQLRFWELAFWCNGLGVAGVVAAALGGWLGGELAYRHRLPVGPAYRAPLPTVESSPKMPS